MPKTYKVNRLIESVEHVFVVVADSPNAAKIAVAESHNFLTLGPDGKDLRCGLWSVSELTEDHGVIKLYEFNRKTGEMIL